MVRKIGTANHTFESVKDVAEVTPRWHSWDGKDDGYAPDEYRVHALNSPYGGVIGVILPSATPGRYAAYWDIDGAREYLGTVDTVWQATQAIVGPVKGGGYLRKGGK
ncbi:hypothetical protein [Streptomyces wuyuanensis]|uniref:hypothetical protein n=1 Tax=Streptomyces wuyuanensis TaxID=1196353 RepID=UPI0034337C0B